MKIVSDCLITAQTKAQSQAVEEIEKLQDLYSGTDLTSRLFRVEEYQEPTDWCKEIDELSAFEETDSGLWEGMKNIEEQVNARATYTYANAIYDSAERIIRERITELLECPHSNCDDNAKCIQCGEQQ